MKSFEPTKTATSKNKSPTISTKRIEERIYRIIVNNLSKVIYFPNKLYEQRTTIQSNLWRTLCDSTSCLYVSVKQRNAFYGVRVWFNILNHSLSHFAHLSCCCCRSVQVERVRDCVWILCDYMSYVLRTL